MRAFVDRRVALVGVGTMGRWLARHLLDAGATLAVFDRNPDAIADAVARGARRGTSAADAARGSEIILLSLPSPAAVEEIALGDDGVRDGLTEGAIVVDCSTSPPALARRVAAGLDALGIASLDAPVSGGPVGAEAGTLTVMVGGSAAAFARVEPVLHTFGSHVVHVGDHGAGQAAKLCNNLLAGTHMAVLAESVAIARAEGLDLRVLYDLLTRSTGDSRVLRNRYPVAGVDARHPASRDFEPLFTVDLMTKDLELALDLAAVHGVSSELVTAAHAAYQRAQEQGFGGLDYSAVGSRD